VPAHYDHRTGPTSTSAELALGRVQLVLDAAIVVAAMLLATQLHAWLAPLLPVVRRIPHFTEHAALVYVTLPLWLVLVTAFRAHLVVAQRVGHAELLVRLLKVHVTGLALLSVVAFTTQAIINRSLVVLFLIVTFALMYAQRLAMFGWARYQHARGIGRERILLVGRPSKRMSALVSAASAGEFPAQVLGYLETPLEADGLSLPPSGAPAVPCLGPQRDLARILHEQAVDHVLFLPPAHQPQQVREELLACEAVGVGASFAVDLVQLADAAPRVTSKYEHAFITFEVSPKRADLLAIKYGLDPILAAFTLLLLAPVLLVVAGAIAVSMGRPVLFAQARGGLFGRPFRMLKFRTMRDGAEQERDALVADNEMSGPVFKIKDDPRVTPLGRLLRRTSLDELPQLFNVLTGSMSLVGPRPLPVSEQQQIRGWQRRRLTMKPGITCLWQVGGRNDVDFAEWMLLDLKYIDDWSLWLDVQILLRTLPAVLLRRGAS
jgi:exopolysaccharide biosynthesis polyprenyl glycosylphosphotransferase